MGKLTVNQVAALIGKTAYTIKRWYSWYEQLSEKELKEYIKSGMPELPKYETVGPTQWRYWEDTDIEQLKKFSNWVPHTKNGVFLKNKED